MSLLQRFRRDCRGSHAVEFALIAPIMIMVLSGIINYGLYFSTSHALQQIANNAARSALAGLTHAERLELARDTFTQDVETYGFLSADRALLDLSEADHKITVTLQYTNNSIGLPLIEPPAQIQREAVIALGGY